jgi:hypothetical protein
MKIGGRKLIRKSLETSYMSALIFASMHDEKSANTDSANLTVDMKALTLWSHHCNGQRGLERYVMSVCAKIVASHGKVVLDTYRASENSHEETAKASQRLSRANRLFARMMGVSVMTCLSSKKLVLTILGNFRFCHVNYRYLCCVRSTKSLVVTCDSVFIATSTKFWKIPLPKSQETCDHYCLTSCQLFKAQALSFNFGTKELQDDVDVDPSVNDKNNV